MGEAARPRESHGWQLWFGELFEVRWRALRERVRRLKAELGETDAGGVHYQSLFMLGCVLFVITLIISISAEIIANKKQK